MSLKDILRSCTPSVLLNWNRKRKKEIRNVALDSQKANQQSLSENDLVENLLEYQRIISTDVELNLSEVF